ncbi:MAG: hypothetical protein KBA95_05720, partial [Acidobacteria bacterium]|nr:hypothetical protein [Acidobacteriota bacterium]
MSNEHYRRLDERQTDLVGGNLALDRAWCADEVHLDFPAIPASVDRIRAGFVADEPPQPLQAALRLTPREAVAAATLPVAGPRRVT